MRKIILLVISMLAVQLSIVPAIANEDNYFHKSVWYAGFGLGSGNGVWTSKNGDEETTAFYRESTGQLTVNIGLGVNIGQNFHCGYEYSTFDHSSNYEDINESLDISNHFLIAAYFPSEIGFFIKGGAGFSQIKFANKIVNEKSRGNGFLLGCGYYFWLGETFNLGLHFDYTFQQYRTGNIKNSSFYSIYASCYWF